MSTKNLIGLNRQATEDFNIKILDLHSNKTNKIENGFGNSLEWYGKRLNFIKLFYNKTTVELSVYLGVSVTMISSWERNKSKPSEKQIEKLATLFELAPSFFTEESITITINQQLEINQII